MCSSRCTWILAFLGAVLIVGIPAAAEVELAGKADRAAVVEAGQARFTVLTPTLLRLEYAADGVFEDRPSMFAVQRKLPAPQFAQRRDGEWLVVETERLRLRYRTGGGKFDASNLRIDVQGAGRTVRWTPGMANPGNLGGTVRTLDQCRGPIPLGEGVLSRDGWYVLDDSPHLLLDGEPDPWPTPRRQGDRLDWYFFGYGRDYARALSDLVAVGGRIPLPPRFVFGSWYSRYWPHTSEDFLAIAEGYRQRGYPLDVMVIDMDWHLKGWTGYTWNRELIPDPKDLLKALHDRGLHVTLNLHPHAGVQPHEAAYPEFARAMGVDPESQQGIPFDCTDRGYVENYFKLLHHPLEASGVDFWWVDWQQQRTTKLPGLDPLPWLNHLHFRDRGREGTGRRGLSFSRWGGWGDHRHVIQFSGDTESTWKVLKFLVPFTSAAGNVGAAYWSHDTGGHWSPKGQGRISAELYARWLQFCGFTAAMRVHSTRDPDNDRRPWIYGQEFERSAHAAYELRYRLLPYIYTMARKTYETGLPLCRPMYLHHPDEPRAYEVPGQFYFGDDMIVAPAVEPGRGRAKIADVEVWLPEGEWYDLLTNVRYEGPTETLVKVPLDRIPVFVRSGRPIPMQPPGRLNTQDPIDPLVVRIYPGPTGETILYEDDGESPDYKTPGGFAKTRITYSPDTETGALELVIHPVEGSYRGMPKSRTVIVEIGSTLEPEAVIVDDKPIAKHRGWNADVSDETTSVWAYSAAELMTTVRLPEGAASEPAAVRLVLRPQHRRLATERELVAVRTVAEENWHRQLSDEHVQKLNLLSGVFFPDPEDPRSPHALVEYLASISVECLGLQRGPALEALFGGAIRDVTFAADTKGVRMTGGVWLSRFPADGPVSGKVVLSIPGHADPKLHQQPIVFERPGKQPFVFDLPIDPHRLHDVRVEILADLGWGFSREFEWDNSFIARWHVVGPFAGGKGPRAQTLEPETDPAPDRQYVGMDGQVVHWQAIDVRKGAADPGLVDLKRIFGGQNVTAFGQAFLESEADAEVEFVMRHDDGVIVWVNGQEVYAFENPRSLAAGPTPFPVRLKKGLNTVLVKVDQLGGGWGFVIRVRPLGGRTWPMIRLAEPS